MGHDPDGLSQQFNATPAELEVLYDQWADGYDADMRAWGYTAPLDIAQRLVTLRPGVAPVLDAGCGTGLSGLALGAVGYADVVGIDLSPESLDVARERQVYSELRQTDLSLPLPFGDAAFAAVVSSGVLSYLPDTDPVLREFLRVCRPGGVVVFSQRTDLWADRHYPDVLARLASEQLATYSFSEPFPYLPGHPEYRDEIKVIYTELERL